MKYIMLVIESDTGMKRKIPIIFPSILVHSDVAKAVKKLPQLKGAKVVSAGSYDTLTGRCSGGSETLKVHSAETDGHTIRMYQYQHGIE